MTEFTPVVAVVDFYWTDSMNGSSFSLYGRVFSLYVWDYAASQSAYRLLTRPRIDPGTYYLGE